MPKVTYIFFSCFCCVIGGGKNFFHCNKCRCCYSVLLKNSHPCVEGAMHNDCPVCFEYLFESRNDVTVMPCGHTIHESCLKDMHEHYRYACPICSKSACDMSKAMCRDSCIVPGAAATEIELARRLKEFSFQGNRTSKKQYHCNGCGICRIGGRENFFHCNKCRCCYSVLLKNSHPCVEGAMHNDRLLALSTCPQAHANQKRFLQYLFESRNDVTVMPCGHTIHESCLKDMHEHYR
ncbi:putative E3 ubiquitin-protein ligase RZFP34 [Camellia lanceoleosa]|uniref:E3 ubiquitin-protein ligase RZFP34 n=1 Tax=Camellia lanceoleosa TaxID=1840588 RepID=A0ACC0HQY6_9ERIC|nr:putative E3 ubiquitin-protein ligase RZFP34 [Camellia lanceoleosa]